MFKLESYIAPILLSYVDKYIKNFKLEDSQVSLWGGDASFQNLDLRLEVLEHELQSPFSFISGHIRELLIHVPWTKLTSEPITITINTIECVLKLREHGASVPTEVYNLVNKDKNRKAVNKQLAETPPNYVQLLINKIVNNIRIFCNNLILKYVEEDIVLSMNVRHFKLESCNDKWEPTFIDILPTHIMLRKVISIHDLTICLDKRNSTGKIDVYQEPMLYKCSMTMHFLRSYTASNAHKSSRTRLDIYCNNMEFSMTEQQIPMAYRLLMLLYALHQKKLKLQSELLDNQSNQSDTQNYDGNNETWTNWAWSYVSSVLPTQWDEDIDQDEFLNQLGHIIQIGYYVDNASVTFKISECSEKGYYNQKKIRYNPLLTFQLQGIYTEIIMISFKWINCTFGISEIILLPIGMCTCSYQEIDDDRSVYLKIGQQSNHHKTDSLFDAEAPENHGNYRNYSTNWDYHNSTNTDSVLLERTPALVFDYVYEMGIPDDLTNDIISDPGSNLEYSNFAERSSLRICLGQLRLLFCSGLLHRFKTLMIAASFYEYSPYYIDKLDPAMNELLPPSEEDFDSLNEYIPTRSMRIMIYNPMIELYLMDHPEFTPTKECLAKKSKKSRNLQSKSINLLPKLTIECKSIEFNKFDPMYLNRLIHTTCQLPEPPKQMFDSCFTKYNLNIIGLTSRLILKTIHQTTILIPTNLRLISKIINKPQYWLNPDIIHYEILLELDNLTLNGTNPKLMVIVDILQSLLNCYDIKKNYIHTSLLFDAAKDYDLPYLEIVIENFHIKKLQTNSTTTSTIHLGSIKGFIYESIQQSNDIQQVLFLSGYDLKTNHLPLFHLILQYSLDPNRQNHPSVLLINLQEIKICIDPLLFKWLLYYPVILTVKQDNFDINSSSSNKMRNFSETLGTISETTTTTKKISHIESVHSSSDREKSLNLKLQPIKLNDDDQKIDIQDQIYQFLKDWYNVWKGVVINGYISQCTIYVPTNSISAIGSQDIDEAITNHKQPNLMIITLPSATIQSGQKRNIFEFVDELPVKLPQDLWNLERTSFPWTLTISDLNITTVQDENCIDLLKAVTLNATIGLSTKSDSLLQSSSSIMEQLGIYVHIDITPIVVSLISTQIYLLLTIYHGFRDGFTKLFPERCEKKSNDLPPITVNSPTISPTVRDNNTIDNTSENTISIDDRLVDNSDNLKLTTWIQWTITKFSIELLMDNKKLLIDIEDIVSSLDYQSIYLKFKSKIGTISIQHFVRDSGDMRWKSGEFSGIIMRLRDDIAIEKRHDDSGFINLTITRASRQHTYNLWGTTQNNKIKKELMKASRYLTEIVLNIQPFDLIVPPTILMDFYSNFLPKINDNRNEINLNTNNQWFNNQRLPLAYLECQSLRILIPTRSDRLLNDHNVVILQINKITSSPTVTNPICRTPIRPDLYRQAAQTRILNIPGSELEDRQYQLDCMGFSVSTMRFDDFETIQLNRCNINENPALEWNNLQNGQFTISPSLNYKQIIERIDLSVVAAPAMIYKTDDLIICGNSFEINFLSDVTVQISFDQMQLLSKIIEEFTRINDDRKFDLIQPYLHFDPTTFTNNIESEMNDFYKDSGVDTSDIRSVLSSKQIMQFQKKLLKPIQHQVQIPIDILFTAGKISLILYQQQSDRKLVKSTKRIDDDQNYEASEEESVEDVNQQTIKYSALLYLQIAQPNAYFSIQQLSKRTQISCFDLTIKTNNYDNFQTNLPTQQDFYVSLLETKSGNPHPITGIPPAFFTLKFANELGKITDFSIQISRPTRLTLSTRKLYDLLILQNRIGDLLNLKQSDSNYCKESNFRRFKQNCRGVDSIVLQTDQLVFVWETERFQTILSVNHLINRLFLYERPEKISNITEIKCCNLNIIESEQQYNLINSWSFTVETACFFETWQTDDNPLMHIALNCDCFILNLCPERIKNCEFLLKDITELSTIFNEKLQQFDIEQSQQPDEKEQYYKDDLRAGAFQFIDTNSNNLDELPLPYQVLFWNNPEMTAMAWRYPHPRILTKIRVFPVPFEISSNIETKRLICRLQYWCDYQQIFVNYLQFYLSETDVNYLNLPKIEPQRGVASIWRVILINLDSDRQQIPISPRALAACMRIDSYFNNKLIPTLTALININRIELNLFSYFNKTSTILPDYLRNYNWDALIPDNHCFLRLLCNNSRLNLARWPSGTSSIELSSSIKSNVLDYMFLVEKSLLDEFYFKIDINIGRELQLSLISDNLRLIFGPSIAHTLIVNSKLWLQHFKQYEHNFILLTRYIICNDTNITLKFGQIDTDEEIYLISKSFHLYCWRSQNSQRKLHLTIDKNWSLSFYIDYDGCFELPLNTDNYTIIVTIKSLSPTQKQIILTGQLIISNMLLEHFELKLIPPKNENESKKTPIEIVKGKTVAPSILLRSNDEYFMRLRFLGLDSAWTGDIPLREHTRGAQPWLVKVPLQERGQFLSIWCRIVVEEFQKTRRILALLWPLFAIKSNLPIPSKIHVFTPSLNVHLDSMVNGKGELQQLYCPGTIDHSHQLTFKLDDGSAISQAYIPLNYSLVDHEQFFKKNDRDSIEEILGKLRNYNESKWPYFGDEWDDVDWIVDEQPQTTVQIRYRNACQYSSALLVELIPWCLFVNTFGCTISLMSNGIELCRIPQYGIVTPPKLEETFHLGIDTGLNWSYSNPLQLAKSDWSQAFYMPTISGTLPIDGNLKTIVNCGRYICMVNISSSIMDEIRLLMLSSTHIFSNRMITQIQVLCLAVPDNNTKYEIPKNLDGFSFSVAPNSDEKSGISILRWYCVDDAPDNNYALYICLALEPEYGWSCPIRVDKTIRKSIAINSGNQSFPVVVITTELRGQIYISLYHDDRPQLLIENQIETPVYCGQVLNDNDGIIEETKHFKWLNRIDNQRNVYYTMPLVSEKFPELPQTTFIEKIVFSYTNTILSNEWSLPISVTSNSEQYLRIPGYGDVKLVVKITAYTTLLSIEPVSQVEINALDIRARLSQHEKGEIQEEFSIDYQSKSDTNICLNTYNNLFVSTLPINMSSIKICTFIKSINIVLISDEDIENEIQEIASFTFDNIAIEMRQNQMLDIRLSIVDLQFDNQLYMRESYDFPVVLVSRESKQKNDLDIFAINCQDFNELIDKNPLVDVILTVETWKDSMRNCTISGVRDLTIILNPISCFIEDLYITRLSEYFKSLFPLKSPEYRINQKLKYTKTYCKIPDLIVWQSGIMARPLNLKNLTIEPLSLLLSVHSSVKMYIALDQSPLQFSRFKRKNLLTTPYRLGHAMTMHYLSGAIFGAGWVVSSLELLGSPSGLARAMGMGLRDFINLPYRGLIQGPWAFLIGITQGSASLMKHVTAGTLQSVTKLASSVARNLDRLTLDDEHLKRTEEQRRQKPQGVAEGFKQGLTGLGISLLGAVGGIAHHPLRSLISDGASPRSLVAGFGLGLVGVFTKPLSGAAELVALTGQGLLQGAGWNSLPQPRAKQTELIKYTQYSSLKYEWKLINTITKTLLFLIEATSTDYRGVVLILTKDCLIIVDLDTDSVQRVISLQQLQIVKDTKDPTLICLKVIKPIVLPKIEDETEMDPACRARIVDYVRSTATLLQLPSNCENDTISFDECNETIRFYINPLCRKHFLCLFNMAKQQTQTNCNFPVL